MRICPSPTENEKEDYIGNTRFKLNIEVSPINKWNNQTGFIV